MGAFPAWLGFLSKGEVRHCLSASRSAEREEEEADLWVGELEADDVLGLAREPAADEEAMEECEEDGHVVADLAEDPVWDVDDGHLVLVTGRKGRWRGQGSRRRLQETRRAEFQFRSTPTRPRRARPTLFSRLPSILLSAPDAAAAISPSLSLPTRSTGPDPSPSRCQTPVCVLACSPTQARWSSPSNRPPPSLARPS